MRLTTAFLARSRVLCGPAAFFLTLTGAAHESAAGRASTGPPPVRSTPAASRGLHLHLVNEAGADARTLDAARAEASAIWESAGLRLTWTSAPVPFDVRDGRTVVVMVRRALSRSPRLDDAASDGRSQPPLGRIVVGPDGRPGSLIEVSFDRLTSQVMHGSLFKKPITALPELLRMSLLGRGLGRVVAHEIGHWLMGRGHEQEGLMRAAFGLRELLDLHAPRLPRAWTAADSELRQVLSRCERETHPDQKRSTIRLPS